MDLPGERLDNNTVRVAYLSGERRVALIERNAAPQADGNLAVATLAGAVEGNRVDGFAADQQRHGLARPMLDRDADHRRPRILVFLGEQPPHAGLLAGKPVPIGSRGLLV